MKQLQNNFTTPKQSKKLLELGLPADSADCYYTQENIEGNMYWFNLNIKREYQPHSDLHSSITWGETLPCWSVGRLMEIQEKCTGARFFRTLHPDLLGDIMGQIEYTVGTVGIDFSKLNK